MKRWMHATSYVHGGPAATRDRLLDHHVQLLARATGSPTPTRAADGTFELRLRAPLAARELSKQVRVTVGVAARSGERVILPLGWAATPVRHAFPRFDGALELEPVSSSASLLALTGAYEPPLGAVGVAIDSTVLRDCAEQTAQHLVTQLSRVLSADDDDQPPSPTPPPAADRGSTPRMRVRDVMTTDVRMITAAANLRAAAAVLFAAGISGMPVVGDDGALIGVITTADLLSRQAPPAMGFGAQVADRRRRQDALTAVDACSSPAIVVTPDATVRDAARRMLDHDVARLVVIDRGAVVGIVSRHDVLAALLRADDLIAAAIDKVLRDHDETAVAAAVSDGVVTLTGAVGLRSVAAALPRIVSGLDGVVSVATNLRWDTDDVRSVAPTR